MSDYQKQKSKLKKIIEYVFTTLLFVFFLFFSFISWKSDKSFEPSYFVCLMASMLFFCVVTVPYFLIDYIIYYIKLSASRKEKQIKALDKTENQTIKIRCSSCKELLNEIDKFCTKCGKEQVKDV